MQTTYKEELKNYKGLDVIIHLANGVDIEGRDVDTNESGCFVERPGLDNILIAFKDMLGVGLKNFDYASTN